MNIDLATNFRTAVLAASVAAATVVGGCTSESATGGMFSTGSIAAPSVEAKSMPDPMCVTLSSQIDTLRKEGAVERLEKAADGKSSNVSVQRASLVKQAQLNKANADFITKCGPSLPKTAMNAAAPAAAAIAVAKPAAAASAIKTAAAAPAAKAVAAPKAQELGVTVATPVVPVVPAAPAQ